MHDTAYYIGGKFLTLYWHKNSTSILEIGARNVNGSLRELAASNAEYVGIDLEPGDGVDLVLDDPYEFPFDDDSFDIVMSTSCFEHDQMFWLTFCEMARVAKPGGYIYINAPSNGKYHGYPYDNWRFYPDSGLALEAWAKRNSFSVSLLESFTAQRDSDIWNDFVAVFCKGSGEEGMQEPRLAEALTGAMNVRTKGSSELERFSESPEDMQIIEELRAMISEKDRTISDLKRTLAAFFKGGTTPEGETDRDLELPPEFDQSIYRSLHQDLQDFSNEDLWQHYQDHGKEEGRPCSLIENRHQFIKLVERSGSILEIGPFFNPALSKKDSNVEYMDFCDSEELRERAKDIPDASGQEIPHIDYVWSGQPYTDLIDKRFASVFSSHCIEHQPCLVRHLEEVASILKPGGYYFLAIPDKRYCFDHYMPITTFADVVSAFTEQRQRHSVRSVLLHRFFTVHNDPARHWNGDHEENPFDHFMDPDTITDDVKGSVDELRNSDEYIDTHAWYFTPQSFRVICKALNRLDLIKVKVERIYSTVKNSNEFYAVLKF